VYVRDQAQIKHYVFAARSSESTTSVYDASTLAASSLISKVATGDKPVHIYAVPSRDEVWCHNDNAGTFDVFHMSQVRSFGIVSQYLESLRVNRRVPKSL
jgi:hypothetical protein